MKPNPVNSSLCQCELSQYRAGRCGTDTDTGTVTLAVVCTTSPMIPPCYDEGPCSAIHQL